MHRDDFGPGFLFGASTAAYQIEGAVDVDGRGPSIWDTFSATPGKVENGDTGAVACDHYHRYADDIGLMRELGLQAYRFSTAWPRILPEGTGAVNQKGLDFYNRLIDGLLEAGIEPWLCLYHWDLPQALQDRGGWATREAADWFADYATVVGRAFGDRVKHFIPFNEPNVVVWVGNCMGVHAPGIADRETTLSVLHTVNLAHGRAITALRSVVPEAQYGHVVAIQPCSPLIDDEAHRRASDLQDMFWNQAMVDPQLLGRYPDALAEMLGSRVHDGDLATIAQPLNFFGMNHYSRIFISPDDSNPFGIAMGGPGPERMAAGAKVTEMGWLIDGTGFTDALTGFKQRYGDVPIYITENGAAFDDTVAADGTVDDPDRVAFLKEYWQGLQAAKAQGVDVRGYFVWSLMDNFEWALGYGKRFGIVHVDYDTQKRTPKTSARMYQNLIAGRTI